MARAYLGLGANLPPAEERLQETERALESRGMMILARSSLYRTEPWGNPDQPWYLNRVLDVQTELAPLELLEACKAVERALGREERARWGPREIDVDILLYGQETVREEGLEIPHPRIAERRFVLVPLVELAPRAIHPVYRRTTEELLHTLDDRRRVERVTER